MTTSIKEHAQTTYSVTHYATCCCRPAHKRECKQKAQQQLRVNISSKPPGGGAGPANSWVGVNQSDVAKWFAGQVNGTGKGKYPEAKTMSGSIAVKHEKLFDVKIQVIVFVKICLYQVLPAFSERLYCRVQDNALCTLGSADSKGAQLSCCIYKYSL